MKYIKEHDIDLLTNSRKSISELCAGKEERQMMKDCALKQAQKYASKHVDNFASFISKFNSGEIDNAQMLELGKKERQGYFDDVELDGIGKNLSQFEITLIWNNTVKRLRETI